MNTKRIFIVAALGLAIIAGYRFFGSKDVPGELNGRGEDGGRTRVSAPGLAQLHQLAGIVRDAERDSPIADAKVRIESAAPTDNAGEARRVRTVEIVAADASGRWKVAELRAGHYRVTAVAPGYLAQTVGATVDGSDQMLSIALYKGGFRVTGRVSDIAGGVVAGAVVVARRLVENRVVGWGMSSEGGDFGLSLAAGKYRLEVRFDGYVPAHRVVEVMTDRVEDFRMNPASRIEGRVVDSSSGEGVGGIAVVVESRAKDLGADADLMNVLTGRPTARTGMSKNDGSFAFSGLAPGTHEVRAYGAGVGAVNSTAVTLALGETRADVLVFVDTAVSVSGRVLDSTTGEGVAGIRVVAERRGGGGRMAAPLLTNAKGDFKIDGATPGNYTVHTQRRAGAYTPGSVDVIVDAADVHGIELQLDRGVVLRGHVVPAVAAAVRLQAPDRTGLNFMTTALAAETGISSTADESGRFELRGVPRGRWLVIAEDGDTKASLRLNVQRDEDNLELVLEERAHVCGHVEDGNGKRLSDVRVTMSSTRQVSAMSQVVLRGIRHHIRASGTSTSSNGEFCLKGVDPGQYFIYVNAPSGFLSWKPSHYKDTQYVPLVVAKGQHIDDYVLRVQERDGHIKGRVVDARGEPIADAYVTARSLVHFSGAVQVPALNEARDEQAVPTNSDGEFVIENLREGAYHVVARAPRGAGQAENPLVMPGKTIELRIASPHRVSGRADGDVGAWCQVTLRRKGAMERRAGRGRACEFAFAEVAPGAYTVELSAHQGSGKVAIDLDAADVALPPIHLEPLAALTGKVIDSAGEPVVGARILLIYDDGESELLIQSMGMGTLPKTDATGHFELKRLHPGEATLIVMTPAADRPLLTKPLQLAARSIDLGTLEVGTQPK